MSVPSGNVGLGRDPGLRTTFGTAVVGVGDVELAPIEVDRGAVDFEDDEQPASSATARPAPATAIPFNNERLVTESIAKVYRDAHGARTAATSRAISRDRG
jgi:hypothetical protein